MPTWNLLSLYSFHGSGLFLLYHETSGFFVADLIVNRIAADIPEASTQKRGISCKVDYYIIFL